MPEPQESVQNNIQNNQEKQTTYDRAKELTDRLEEGMTELLQSDKYAEYLKSMSYFHQYSNRNIMLINLQHPGATKVGSYKMWEEKFNRHVKKGEKSIRIFAPVADKAPKKKLMEKLDPETGTPLLDGDGKVIMEEMTALTNGLRFKLVPIFDIDQTYGDPLPELVENLTGNVEHYEAFMDSLRAVSPLPIEFEPLRDGNDGYCRYGEKIGIREGMSEVQTVAAVIHEIGHARLHDKGMENADAPKYVRETQSEGLAYVVAQHYRIETAPNSFGYLASWGGQDMQGFKASLDVIRKEANSLIGAIDMHFNAICQERGIELIKNDELRIENETTPEVAATSELNSQLIMPDPAISLSERDLYGYTFEGMLPLTWDRALELFDQDQPIYLLYPDNTEAMAFDRSEVENHGGIFGIDCDEWHRTLEYTAQSAKNSEAARESELIHGNADTFAIYQLRDGDDLHYHRYSSLKQLENDHLAVDRGNYVLAYTAPLPPKETLDDIYQRFNTEHPKDFTGHSLAVSDVVVIQRGGEVTSHYVDRFGFAELSVFLGDERHPVSAAAPEQADTANEKTLEKPVPTVDDRKAAPTAEDNKVPTLPESNNQPVYMQSPDHARENGELDRYRESLNLNKECAAAIDAAIKDCIVPNGHGYRLTPEAVSKVIDDYGEQRVSVVLANTVRLQEWDGRYSDETKAWAKNTEMPKVRDERSFFSASHPAVLDGYIKLARKEIERKPSIIEALKQGAEKSRRQTEHNQETKKSNELEV